MPHNLLSSIQLATLSSVIENIVVYPLDVYKTIRQQTRMSAHEFLKTSLQFKYRGFYTRLYGNVPMRVIFWTSQDAYASWWNSLYGLDVMPTGVQSVLKCTTISGLSALNQTIVDCPIENIKIQQIQHGFVPKSFTWKLSTFYAGFFPHYIRNSIFIFGVYASNTFCDTHCDTSTYSRIFWGALGGLTGCILSQPFDYIKTLRQSHIPVRTGDVWNSIFTGCTRHTPYIGSTPRILAATIGMGIGSHIYYYFKEV